MTRPMKKVVLILVALFLSISLSSVSTEVKPCNANCYWSDNLYNCYCDAIGARCLLVKYPNPYSVYTPCVGCVDVTGK